MADLLFIFDARCKVMTNAFPSFGLLNFYSQGITHVWRMVARKLQILKMAGLVDDSDDEIYNGMFLCKSCRRHFHLRTDRDS